MLSIRQLAVVSSVAISSVALAQDAVQWRVEDGGNGHWYRLQNDGGTWEQARLSAESQGGHLATITSSAENQFIWQLLNKSTFYPCFAMLGGYQDLTASDYVEPAGGWRWVTGEEFVFTAWYSIEPNNAGAEHYLAFREFNCSGSWNDIPDDYSSSDTYVVEWSADCNGDGIVDYGQCHDGTLADYNGNNIPDCCERGEACVVGNYPVQWRVADGGNGHWYAISAEYSGWTVARDNALRLGADLAGMETNPEWLWTRSWIPSILHGYWLGARQQPFSPTPSDGWYWLNGSPVSQEWMVMDDNPCGASPPGVENMQQDFLHTCCEAYPQGRSWGDLDDLGGWGCDISLRALIEWSADCNNDGIVDYGQIRVGELADTNGDNVPDCCEAASACPNPLPPREWPLTAGGNGHWYQLQIDPLRSFSDFNAHCALKGGHMSTITTAAEHGFVIALMNEQNWFGRIGWPAIGLRRADASSPWAWVTGEPVSYLPWANGEPGEAGRFAQLWGNGSTPNLTWSANGNPFVSAGVIEWSADCNNDGIVDFGQIRSGQLADANGNNIPDGCEFITVPTDFATVQGAIDSVAIGSQRVIRLLPGTYNQSFALNGKNVVIRGAADGSTILDGGGLTGSIAKLSGELSTAGLENLVFRNGTTGSRFTPDATFTVGGAIYANSTAAFIRNCRFESCRADFGGAIYQYAGSIAWDNCVFTGNIANSDGGGAQTYNCTGMLRNCTFTGNRCGMNGPGSGSGYKAIGSNGEGETVTIDSCAFSGNIAGDSGSAIEFYEHVKFHPGVLQILNTSITGNISGEPIPSGAGGVRVLGRQSSCLIGAGTVICGNTQRNVSGPYLASGSPTICDCLADLSGDGVVNAADLGLLLSSWGIAGSAGNGDVNRDGVVNAQDLGELLANWGICD